MGLAFGLLLAFAALTIAVVRESPPLMRIDQRMAAAIRRVRSARADTIVAPLSMLATQEPLALQSLVAVIMVGVTIGRLAVAHFAVAAVGSGALSEIVKRTVRRRRPPGPHLLPWLRGFSYPSGDALTASAIYVTITVIAGPHLPDELARKALLAILVCVLLVVAGGRVYAGVHYLSDVIAGLCLGTAWALLVSALFVATGG